MLLDKKIRKSVAAQGEVAIKAVSAHIFLLGTFVTHALVFWLSTKGSIFPGDDELMAIIGTCSEIIAGLYGITLAGYTFFLSRIDALTAADMTLDYVVASLKKRFKYLIWFITYNVLMTLFISIFLMYCPVPNQENHVFLYRLFCNEFVLSMGYSIGLILYYSILVVDPNCLEKEAAKLKRKLSRPVGPGGNAVEFIALYDRIETRCNSMLPEDVVKQIHENKGKRFAYTIELLFEQNLLAWPLVRDLNRIHRYYECMVNCFPISVTREMCLVASNVLEYLEQADLKPVPRR